MLSSVEAETEKIVGLIPGDGGEPPFAALPL